MLAGYPARDVRASDEDVHLIRAKGPDSRDDIGLQLGQLRGARYRHGEMYRNAISTDSDMANGIRRLVRAKVCADDIVKGECYVTRARFVGTRTAIKRDGGFRMGTGAHGGKLALSQPAGCDGCLNVPAAVRRVVESAAATAATVLSFARVLPARPGFGDA